MANYERLLREALGEAPADAVITGGLLVNVLTREIYPATVGICEDTIAYVTGAEDAAAAGTRGRWLWRLCPWPAFWPTGRWLKSR